eukprot:5502903-Pyramimonas_sp.AAC.1
MIARMIKDLIDAVDHQSVDGKPDATVSESIENYQKKEATSLSSAMATKQQVETTWSTLFPPERNIEYEERAGYAEALKVVSHVTEALSSLRSGLVEKVTKLGMGILKEIAKHADDVGNLINSIPAEDDAKPCGKEKLLTAVTGQSGDKLYTHWCDFKKSLAAIDKLNAKIAPDTEPSSTFTELYRQYDEVKDAVKTQ